jgi:uncharacterized protein DUF4169
VRAVSPAQDGRMGEIVNLRREKQRRERAADAANAKQNRIRHGRSKAAKANDERQEQRRRALLDASRRGETAE